MSALKFEWEKCFLLTPHWTQHALHFTTGEAIKVISLYVPAQRLRLDVDNQNEIVPAIRIGKNEIEVPLHKQAEFFELARHGFVDKKGHIEESRRAGLRVKQETGSDQKYKFTLKMRPTRAMLKEALADFSKEKRREILRDVKTRIELKLKLPDAEIYENQILTRDTYWIRKVKHPMQGTWNLPSTPENEWSLHVLERNRQDATLKGGIAEFESEEFKGDPPEHPKWLVNPRIWVSSNRQMSRMDQSKFDEIYRTARNSEFTR